MTANIFPIRSSRQHKETIMQQLQFAQNSRRTMGAIVFTCLHLQYETRSKSFHSHMRWNPVSAEINEAFAIDFNETTILISVYTLSHSFVRFLTKKSGKLHHRDPIHYSHFHMAEGRNVLIQWEDCDVYLVQQFALSQSAVFIHKRSSVLQTSAITVDKKNIFLSLIWLLISLWQLFIVHFHCLGRKNKAHMKC